MNSQLQPVLFPELGWKSSKHSSHFVRSTLKKMLRMIYLNLELPAVLQHRKRCCDYSIYGDRWRPFWILLIKVMVSLDCSYIIAYKTTSNSCFYAGYCQRYLNYSISVRGGGHRGFYRHQYMTKRITFLQAL